MDTLEWAYSSTEVGKIVKRNNGRFEWIIDNWFRVLHDEFRARYIRSPDLIFAGGIFTILMGNMGSKLMELAVFERSPHRCPIDLNNIHASLGMMTGYKGKMETRSGHMLSKNGGFRTYPWMEYSEMNERRSELLRSDGSFIIFCDLLVTSNDAGNLDITPPIRDERNDKSNDNEASLSYSSDEEETVPQQKSMTKMQEDMKNLLAAGEDSDVVLKVKEKEFPAHRIILKARSAVFKSMFSHDTAESQSGEVTIEDCNPAAFPDFLTYLYTGSSKHIREANVCSLYKIADKYCVSQLKEDCLCFMKSHLSVDLFCDVIVLASCHEEEELMELAANFFCEHMPDIIKTRSWLRLLPENSILANELLIKAVDHK